MDTHVRLHFFKRPETSLITFATGWFPNCYTSFQNLLPAPVVTLEENGQQNVFIAPDSVELLTLFGPDFTNFFANIGFDWQRLAGAKVLSIEGMDPYDYVDTIARTVSGNYLDHGVRVNSVFSSYRISDTDFSQRVGDLAGPPIPTQTDLTFELITVNSTKAETVTVPFLASFFGVPFTDKDSLYVGGLRLRIEFIWADLLLTRKLGEQLRR